jgi:hypothetical protein
METKTLDLILKPFRVLQEESSPSENPPVSGWYLDPATGQRLFYDSGEGKFYTMAGGVYIPLGYMNPSPKQVALAPGDRLQITLSFKYTGPAITGVTGYYCIGVYGTFGFNETMVGQTSFSIPQVTTPPSSPNVNNSYTFTIPTSIGTDWDDIYVKIFGGTPSLGSSALTSYLFGYENALIIVGTNPSISEFKISDFVKV